MSSPKYFKSPIPGYKSLGEIIAILGDGQKSQVFSLKTLKARLEDGHAFSAGAMKDPKFGKFWIVPDEGVEQLIAEDKKIKDLRRQGYFVSLRQAEIALGLDRGDLRRLDLGQERIFSVWMITRRTFLKLKKIGKRDIKKLPRLKEDLLAKLGTGKGFRPAARLHGNWFDVWGIRAIPGAFRTSAYAARAYLFFVRNKKFPSWAKKKNGKWLFRRDYIEADARNNLEYISVVQMARLVGCSLRAIQEWVDQRIIPSEGHFKKYKERKVLRTVFMAMIPLFKLRLETPAIVGLKLKYGQKVPEDIVARVKAEREELREKTRLRHKEHRRASRLAEIESNKPKMEDLRQELRCARDGTEYKGKDPRSEKEIIKEFNRLQKQLSRFEPPEESIHKELFKQGSGKP